jgi:hypothetical protein
VARRRVPGAIPEEPLWDAGRCERKAYESGRDISSGACDLIPTQRSGSHVAGVSHASGLAARRGACCGGRYCKLPERKPSDVPRVGGVPLLRSRPAVRGAPVPLPLLLRSRIGPRGDRSLRPAKPAPRVLQSRSTSRHADGYLVHVAFFSHSRALLGRRSCAGGCLDYCPMCATRTGKLDRFCHQCAAGLPRRVHRSLRR